jgi:hypothetical protein
VVSALLWHLLGDCNCKYNTLLWQFLKKNIELDWRCLLAERERERERERRAQVAMLEEVLRF